MDLIEVLQKLFQQGYEGLAPTDLAFGTVQTVSPLTVLIEGTMQPLPEEALVKTIGVERRTYQGTTSDGASFTVILNPGLVAGDKVVMMRCSAGQRFVLLSKVF